jgi:hypothetical protein
MMVMIHESKFDSSENFGCNDFFRVLGCFTFRRGGGMANVIPITRTNLDRLADQINACVSRSFDGLCQMASLLASARAECREVGIDFKSWCGEHVNLSQNYAYQLAKCGESSDVLKSISDLREYRRQAVENHRKKQSLRNDTRPKPGSIIITEDEDPDYDEPSSVTLPDDMRIRGLLARASQAKEMAEADDMAGIETTDQMREAVSEAARAWINLLSKLEGE